MSKLKYSENYLRVIYSLLLVTPKVLEDHINRHRGGLICALRNFKEPFKDKLEPEQLKQVEDLVALWENNLRRYYDQIKDNTVLDKYVLDILISKLLMTKEDREEVSKYRRQSDKNKVILDILIRRPKDPWNDFLEALKNSKDETNHQIAYLLEKQVASIESHLELQVMSKKLQSGTPLTDIGKYTIKVQKNYDKLVTQIQSVALETMLDKLIQENVVSTDDREEIISCNSTSEKIRLFLRKINNESGSIKFLRALRDDKVYKSLADVIEATEITEGDIQSIKQASTSSEYENRLDVCTMVNVLSAILKTEIPTATPSGDDVTFGADLYRLKSYIKDFIQKDDVDDDIILTVLPQITRILMRLGGQEVKHVLERDLRNIETNLVEKFTKLKAKEKFDKGIPGCLIKDLYDVTVTEGCDAHFEIWTKEDGLCAIWSKDGSMILHSDKYIIEKSGKVHSLEVRNTGLPDKGQYTVKVNDIERQACLHIEEYFTKNPQKMECIEGEDIEFLCEVKEDIFSVRWNKNGIKLKNDKKYIIEQSGKIHTLSIINCELHDVGNYTVNINNRIRTASLIVKEYFTQNMKATIECTEGDNVELFCAVVENNVSAVWEKDSVVVRHSEKYKMKTEGKRHMLSIIKCGLKDAGRYSINVNNRKRLTSVQVREIPAAIRPLSDKEKELYLEIIKSGTETRYYIRIIIIGENGVGKTSLLRRLLGDTIDGVESTDGVDIVHKCKIRLSDGGWVLDGVSDKRKSMISRIKRAVNSKISEDSHMKQKLLGQNDQTNSSESAKEKLHVQFKPKTLQNPRSQKIVYKEEGSIPKNDRQQVTKKNTVLGVSKNVQKPLKINQTKRRDVPNAQSPLSKDDGFKTEDILSQPKPLEVTEYQIETIVGNVLTGTVLNEMSQILNDIEKSCNPDEVLVDCGFWDFAGQRQYYPTHPIFLNPNAVHLLVSNIMKDIKQINTDEGFDKIGEYLDFWFDSIHSCRNEENKAENSREYLHPPIIIVGSRIDMCKENLEERKKEFCRQLMTMLGHEDKKKHLRRICWVSNTEPTDADIGCLRQTIFEIGKEIKSFKEQLPLRWIQLERLMDITREAGVNILSWLDLTSLSSKCSIDDENEIKLFLKYQHKIGTIIYFENLQDNIILNQKWLADAFKCFVSDKFDNNIMLTSGWKTLQDTGKLERELITKLFQKEPQLEFDKHQNHLLNVMELFGILVKLKTLSEDGQMLSSATYYIPCMISKKASIGKINDMFNVNSHECTSTPWLCIQFNFMPLDFFNHILCYYISQYPICIEPSTKREAIYHGMGVFYLDNTRYRKFIVCFSKNTIAIQIWHWKTIERTKYKEIMEELMSVILRIKDKFEPRRVSYCIKLKCPGGDLHNPGGRLSYKELALLRDKDYFCEDHNKCHSTKDFFQTWFADYSESSSMVLDLLKEDNYEHYELRLMLIGEQGTGKTTIARFLVGAGPAIFQKSSIDLYTGWSFFDDGTNEWLNGKQGFTIEDITASMAIRSIKTHEPSIESLIKHDDYSKIIKSSVTKKQFLNKLRDVIKKKLHFKNVVPVTIWDFGGQDLFHSIHQIFLTYNTVYILALDGSRTLNEPCYRDIFLSGRDVARWTQRDYLSWWIRTILFYCRGEKPGIPKIMVILTHKDKLKVTEIEKRRDEIFREIGEMFEDTIKQHLAIEDKLFVNARNNNDPEMQQIKYSLIQQAKNQPTWGEKWPKCFIPLELEIQCLVKKGIAIITIEDMKKINNQQAVRPLTDCELKLFLKFQHSVGKILYFDEPYLDMHIIISPTFLIDAFKSIITDKQFCQGDNQKEEAWDSMGKNGIILKQTVATIWNQKKYIHFFNAMGHLLGLMTHLDILVEARRYDTNHCRIPTEFYYVASMLRKQDTTEYLWSPTFSQRNIALCFETSSSIIPPGLYFRFIGYCLSIWGVKIYGDDNEEMLFHRSAVFTIDPLLDLYVNCEDERVIVRLVHARSRSLIMKDLASSIRECLFAALHKISQFYIKTSSETAENVLSFYVRVCCSSSQEPCSIAIQDISDVWICSRHQIEHGKDLVLSWFTEKTKHRCESFCPVTDPHFLKQTPTDLHLRRLALAYDTNEVKDLVIALGLPYEKWNSLLTYSDDALLKFRALKKCSEIMFFTFENIKAAAENENIQNIHTICKVVRDEHVNLDREPEKWNLVVTDEDIDKLSLLVGQDSLHFLVELGLTCSDWEEMEYSQKENDLVKLNHKILEIWRTNCKKHNVKPVLRTLRQAFENIGINIKTIENMLFN